MIDEASFSPGEAEHAHGAGDRAPDAPLPVFAGRWSSERRARWWWALPVVAVSAVVLLLGPPSWRPAVAAPLLWGVLLLVGLLVTTRRGSTAVDEDGIVVVDRSGATTAVPWSEVTGFTPPRWWRPAQVRRGGGSAVPLPGVGRLGASSLADLWRQGTASASW